MSNSSVYVGTYEKYNAGSITGKWIDPADYADKDDFINACLELHQDENDPELMFQDWEDMPKDYISESHISSEYWDYLETINNSYYDAEVFDSGLSLGIPLESIEEAYWGTYSSDVDFAEECAEDMGATNNDLNWPYTCIDWQWAARELMYDFTEKNGHYFRSNY